MIQQMYVIRQKSTGAVYSGRYWRAWDRASVKLYAKLNHARSAVTGLIRNGEPDENIEIVEYRLTEGGIVPNRRA